MEEKNPRESDVRVDVMILGAGMAGLTLARQLLLNRPEIRILMLDRQAEIPSRKQKVGEATVQVSEQACSEKVAQEQLPAWGRSRKEKHVE